MFLAFWNSHKIKVGAHTLSAYELLILYPLQTLRLSIIFIIRYPNMYKRWNLNGCCAEHEVQKR